MQEKIKDGVKIRVIDSDKLVNAINEGSYDVNLSAVMALGAVMSALPSAQPESKRGKWIKERIYGRGIHRGLCSCCGFDIEQNYKAYKFCPNCGAWMEEGGE